MGTGGHKEGSKPPRPGLPPTYELILWLRATRPQSGTAWGQGSPTAALRAPGRLGRARHAWWPWGVGAVLAPPGPPPSRRLSQGQLRQRSPTAPPGTGVPGQELQASCCWLPPPIAPVSPTLPKPCATSTFTCRSATQGR